MRIRIIGDEDGVRFEDAETGQPVDVRGEAIWDMPEDHGSNLAMLALRSTLTISHLVISKRAPYDPETSSLSYVRCRPETPGPAGLGSAS